MDKFAKAIVAALVAAYAVFEAATVVESAGSTTVTSAEWTRVVVFGLVAGLGTWAVPNAAAKIGSPQVTFQRQSGARSEIQ